MAKKTVALSLDEEVLNKIDETAQELHMSRSAFVNCFLATAVGEKSGAEFFMELLENARAAEESEGQAIGAQLTMA